MEVTDPNNVKIYNLSAGRSLPDWLSRQKRRKLEKKDWDLEHRIELIQDLSMPDVSTSVKVSNDQQYLLTTGIYKPRVRCYDFSQMSMKFERCMDSEVVTFQILSDDYSKIVFLHDDRYVEFHYAPGYYYKLRIPKFGRDLQYYYPTCDLFLVGISNEIYRLNLERGQFLLPFASECQEINKCAVSPEYQILFCGSADGKVEAWDPRAREKVGVLNCAVNCIQYNTSDQFPAVTALNFENGLTMGVGTATGHILLYDIRGNKPFLVKDHMNDLPIKNIEFESKQDLVITMDSSILKIWDKHSGKIFTTVEGKSGFNDMCHLKGTGLFFMANECPKLSTYYIPSIGPAPKWCSFLDSLTEELEEKRTSTIYDDYKFVTKTELEHLGLSHLLGTSMLRAYMHGYFINVHLYRRAKTLAEPFAYDKYKKKKVREKIEEERQSRVKVPKDLPNVNRDLALNLLTNPKKSKDLLTDPRFEQLFKNPDFQIDRNSETYRLLNPTISKLNTQVKKLKKEEVEQQFDEVGDEEGEKEKEKDVKESETESSSEEDEETKNEIKKQYRLITMERKEKEREERKQQREKRRAEAEARIQAEARGSEPKFYELKEGEDFKGIKNLKGRSSRKSLGDRLKSEENTRVFMRAGGCREMKFKMEDRRKKKRESYQEKVMRHKKERKEVSRPVDGAFGRQKFKMWKGQNFV